MKQPLAPAFLTIRFDIEHEESIRYLGTDAGLEREIEAGLRLLGEAGVRGNFAVVASTAEKFPAAVRRIVAAGHGLLGHGRAHAPLAGLGRVRQAETLAAMRSVLSDVSGVPIRGFAAPQDSTDLDTAPAALDAKLAFATYVRGAPRGPRPQAMKVLGHDIPLWILSPQNQPRNGRSDWSILRKDPPWSEPAWDAAAARRDWTAALASAHARGGILNLIAHPWMFPGNAGETGLLFELLKEARNTGVRIAPFEEILESIPLAVSEGHLKPEHHHKRRL